MKSVAFFNIVLFVRKAILKLRISSFNFRDGIVIYYPVCVSNIRRERIVKRRGY